jgi:hypothetical protein
MSEPSPELTLAERARRAAENISLIANCAVTEQPAATLLLYPLQLADEIDYDMVYILDWVRRRRGAPTAAELSARVTEVLRSMHEPARTPEGEFVLFSRGRVLAWELGQLAIDIDAESQNADTTRPVIWFLEELAYQVGVSEPLVVSDREDTLLQAFIDHPVMNEQQLRDKSGFDEAAKMLRTLCKKYDGYFAPAIRLPGSKCGGGYYAKVQPADIRL